MEWVNPLWWEQCPYDTGDKFPYDTGDNFTYSAGDNFPHDKIHIGNNRQVGTLFVADFIFRKTTTGVSLSPA